MTSRKSSLSLATPIPMPDEGNGDMEMEENSHKIDIVLNPNDEHIPHCNGDIVPNDVSLRCQNDDIDATIKPVL